jgi:hypothetical protein
MPPEFWTVLLKSRIETWGISFLPDWLATVDLCEDSSKDLGCSDFRWSLKQSRNPAEMMEWDPDWMLGRLVVIWVKRQIELDCILVCEFSGVLPDRLLRQWRLRIRRRWRVRGR